MESGIRWGTWEAFVLCGAVLRHGSADWAAVAAELRPRTPLPSVVTPQACKAKFSELQEGFPNLDSLFDELRNRRIAELKRELDQSEDSIGSLNSKIEILRAGKEGEMNHSTRPGSVDTKEPSINGRSCDGSFTQDLREDCASRPQSPTSTLLPKNYGSTEYFEGSYRDLSGITSHPWKGWGKKERRTRKRKFNNEIRKGTAPGIWNSTPANVDKDDPSSNCNHKTGVLLEDSCSSGILHGEDNSKPDLMTCLNSILENKGVTVFQGRLESQKKPRYNKIIRQHVDFHSIRSRITDGLITSMNDLLHDLLLLVNNALVFFPKDSHEHKTAILLRKLVMGLWKNCQRPADLSLNSSSHVSQAHESQLLGEKATSLVFTDSNDSLSTKIKRRRGRRPAKSAPARTMKGRKRVGKK